MIKCLLACVFFTVLPASAAQEVTVNHARISYQGIEAEQAKALAEVIAAARQVYIDEFNFKMPEIIVGTVRCGPGQPTTIYNDGKDHLFLLLSSTDKLAKPLRSHTYVLYSLCHELGHLAMARTLGQSDWLTFSAVEGWAHYAGSVVVDCLYKAKGRSLWLDPYYYRREGTARLRKQLKSESPSEVVQAAGQWQKLETIIGRGGFAILFAAWRAVEIDPAQPMESLLNAAVESFGGPKAKSKGVVVGKKDAPDATSKDLQDTPDQEPESKSDMYVQIQVGNKIVHRWGRKTDEELIDWWPSAASLLVKRYATSRLETVTVQPSLLIGEPITLAFDDGSSEGKKSLVSQGHARKFLTPGIGDWYIYGLSIFGERFGQRRPPSHRFEIVLCNERMEKIAAWKKPYALFEWDELSWSRVEIPPTRVPQCFYLCLNFRPTDDQGVYVAFDASTTGNSFMGQPDRSCAPFDKGDWMIRVELDQLKEADPLHAESLK